MSFIEMFFVFNPIEIEKNSNKPILCKIMISNWLSNIVKKYVHKIEMWQLQLLTCVLNEWLKRARFSWNEL